MRKSRFTEPQIVSILKKAESGMAVNEVLNTQLSKDLNEVREMSWAWMLECNEERDHDALGGMTPFEALENAKSSTFEPST